MKDGEAVVVGPFQAATLNWVMGLVVHGGAYPAPGAAADQVVHFAAVDAYCVAREESDSGVYLVLVEYAQLHHHLLLQIYKNIMFLVTFGEIGLLHM